MHSLTVSLSDGERLLDALLKNGAAIAHDCGGTLACASCCVIVRDGLDTLTAPSADEVDMLDRACVAEPGARLACQAVGSGEIVVEIPRAEAPSHEKILPVVATPRAAKFLALQLAKHPGAVAVRLAVEPAGCSGFGYRLDPVGSVREDDKVFESGGVRIVVDLASLPRVQGTTVDLVQEGLARRLRFDNPNARQSCGCGESFGT
ncbi:MAG TPA: iron-sulfur cluster assembly accessory protein [Burkholderiales bacterium]|nr:iron-sulfur cluster assembly accessory protein [Burkholderiales bacterium]